jgi:8-oxo-dGTP pyrophosphatase MutT (NUDIX family)
MYVIYINDRPLTLLSKEELRTCDPALLSKDVNTHLTANYSGKPRTLLHYVDMLEKGSPRVLSVAIVAKDLERLWQDFRSKYKWLPAAGGVVRNVEQDKTLFIFRRGSWDLPKGKIDEGEDAPTAALREVEEETGVNDLTLGEELPTTYHTYLNRKGKRVLKPTYWFRMETNMEKLVPEVEEDIERAEWRRIGEVLDSTDPLYESLRHLLISLDKLR